MTSKNKNALGKGLNMLIPDTGEAVTTRRKRKTNTKTSKEVTKLSINEIEPNKEQARKIFEQHALQELSESIQQFGIIQPIVVQKKADYYEIIAGERRWRAAKLAGLKEVPVIVKNYQEDEILEISLIENIQREDLNAIEEAKAYHTLMDKFQFTQEEVAKKVSKSRSAVTNSLRLLKLSEEVQKMLIDGMISMGHARALLAIEDEEMQITVAKKIVAESLSVREVEEFVKQMGHSKKKDQEEAEDDHRYIYQGIEELLRQVLGNKVTIKNKKNNKGKIEIEYYSQDDLERIVDLLKR